MLPTLITGAEPQTRRTKALEIAESQSSKFDTIFLETDSSKGIAAAREFMAQTTRKPYQSDLTTAIIFEAQQLTTEAQNSLLKTLEEPNDTLSLVLTAPSTDSVLATIASRCQELKLAKSDLPIKKTITAQVKLSQKLEQSEKLGLDQQIQFWTGELEVALAKDTIENKQLKNLHRYNKTLLKLKRAESLSVNKKLLSLIATLEAPETVS